MKTICIYHSKDLDGWMSAAIVKKYIEENPDLYGKNGNINNFLGWNYGDKIPDLTEYNKVIMCDISFPKEEMLKLTKEKQNNFIWIDHHQRTIDETVNYIVKNNVTEPSGFRTKGQLEAACELTWKYFFPNDKMPEIVRLLGRYDCFGHKQQWKSIIGYEEYYEVSNWGNVRNIDRKVLEFQYGARQCISNYEEAYKYLNTSKPEDYIINLIWEKGISIYQYLYTEAKQIYKKAFPIILNNKDTNYKLSNFLCVNQPNFNPSSFNLPYTTDGYDGMTTFEYEGEGKWKFSLRSETIDVSVIAKQYGGGGHKGASGFVCDNETMLKIIS